MAPGDARLADGRSTELEALVALADTARDPGVEGALAGARLALGMELAYVTELADGKQSIRATDGDAGSFGLVQGLAMPIGETYCGRVLAGRLPSLIPDVRIEDRAASLELTERARIGAFASVPLRFAGGELYGTLCAASHSPQPGLGYRELQVLHVFARMVSDQIERRRLLSRREGDARERPLSAADLGELVGAVRASLLDVISRRVAVTGQAARDLLAPERRDDLLQAANLLGRVSAELARQRSRPQA